MSRIFLSYDQRDKDRIGALVAALEARGDEVWSDQDLVTGELPSVRIRDSILDADQVILALSSRTEGKWLKEEAWTALRHSKSLVPLFLDDGAEENFVWPIVADKRPIMMKQPQDIPSAADQIARARLG